MGKGKIKGNRNPSSMWGTGGTDVTFTIWNPSNDFFPAWKPLSEIEREESFNAEIPAGQFQQYLPLYVNNDGVLDSTDSFVLELDLSDTSIGFSQETYILQEGWDQVAGDVAAFGVDSVFNPRFGRSFPEESDLGKMFLVDGTSQPFDAPKLIAGGRFTEVTIIIEDAQSTTPAVRLDSNDNVYFVEDAAGKPGVDAVYAGAGNDRIVGSNFARESIVASFQYEDLIADHLFGEAGNDLLQGGFSDDLLNGGSGNDQLFGELGEDALYGMMGDDILWGDYEENYKDGNNLNERAGRDYLNGGSGNDALFGGAGADLLFGGDGIDYLSAGKKGTTSMHPQWLEGGAGGDRFDFYTDAWVLSKPGSDVDLTDGSRVLEQIFILDFNAAEGDRIGIYVGTSYSSDFESAELPINAPINAEQFHFGTEAADESDRFIFSSGAFYSSGALYFDRDGTGASPKVFLAFIDNTSNLTHQDIVTFDDSNRLPPPSQPLPVIPSVQFSQSIYQVNENADTATLTLSRTGDVRGRSQVQVNITGGTATDADYNNSFPLTVTFGISETSKTINIPIAQDGLVEETEIINFSITTVNDPAAGTVETLTGVIQTAALAIVDDDISPTSQQGASDNKPGNQPGNQPDPLTGNPQKNILVSGRGNDTLRGGAGDEILQSGTGNDRLFGGKGRDIFVLEKGKGRDIIQDFEDKRDYLGLTAGLNFKNLTIRQQGRNALISFGRDELALLKGVRVNQISAVDCTSYVI
ncbi:hypothetical protein H6F87_03800 [Cyanobacteria bacterium FACHB-502]|nr:hypothetical protein [Cyanobacteria bacterium FACHB-502]